LHKRAPPLQSGASRCVHFKFIPKKWGGLAGFHLCVGRPVGLCDDEFDTFASTRPPIIHTSPNSMQRKAASINTWSFILGLWCAYCKPLPLPSRLFTVKLSVCDQPSVRVLYLLPFSCMCARNTPKIHLCTQQTTTASREA